MPSTAGRFRFSTQPRQLTAAQARLADGMVGWAVVAGLHASSESISHLALAAGVKHERIAALVAAGPSRRHLHSASWARLAEHLECRWVRRRRISDPILDSERTATVHTLAEVIDHALGQGLTAAQLAAFARVTPSQIHRARTSGVRSDVAGRIAAACGFGLEPWVHDREDPREKLHGPGWDRVGMYFAPLGWAYPAVRTDASLRSAQRSADTQRQHAATRAAEIEALDKRNTRRLKARNPAAAQQQEAEQAARTFGRIFARMAAVGRHRARTARSK